MPRGSWAHVPQSLGPCPGTLQPQLLSPYAAAAEAHALQGTSCALQWPFWNFTSVFGFTEVAWPSIQVIPKSFWRTVAKEEFWRTVSRECASSGKTLCAASCPASRFPRGHCSPSLGHTPPPLLHSHVVCRFHSYGPPSFRLQDLGEEKYVLLHFCNSYTIKHLASVFVCISVIYIYLFVCVFAYMPIFIEL